MSAFYLFDILRCDVKVLKEVLKGNANLIFPVDINSNEVIKKLFIQYDSIFHLCRQKEPQTSFT